VIAKNNRTPPLRDWFWASYLVTTHTPGFSAWQHQRQLRLARYETAWAMLQRLRRAIDPTGPRSPWSRQGEPATIQQLARFLVDEADHRGVAEMLRRLSELRATDRDFAGMEIDHHREFWDAIRLGEFDTPDAGLAEIANRRTYSRPKPPEKVELVGIYVGGMGGSPTGPRATLEAQRAAFEGMIRSLRRGQSL